MNFDLKNPCKDCPFKEGSSSVVHSERAKEIAEAITEKQGTFTCHKTLVLKEEDRQHCAGAMTMLEHIERPNQMMRIAERLGYYDRLRRITASLPMVWLSITQQGRVFHAVQQR